MKPFDSFYKVILLFIVVSQSDYSSGQISPLYERHVNFEQFINPAITGRDHYPFLNISHKNYWLNKENSPYSFALGGSMRLGKYDFYTPRMMLNKSGMFSRRRMGFGSMLMYESNGPLNYFSSVFSYAYFLPLSPNGVSELSFGISIQLSQYDINESLLAPLDPGDPELNNLSDNYLLPESGFGMYYHNKQFQIGLSINELFQSKQPYYDIYSVKNSRDLFFQSGYKFYLNRFELEPLIFAAKIDERPLYIYNQLKLYYLNYNWVAIAYKSTNTVTISAGIRARRMFFAYAYEVNASRLQRYYGGSHEIMFGVNIGLFEPEGIKKTVRVKK